jgi:FKBP-type peptidyl-prolyl cis-trans isomerase
MIMLSRNTTTSTARPGVTPRRHLATPPTIVAARRHRLAATDNDEAPTTTPTPQTDTTDSNRPKRRRQADSTDAVASFLTRRFGIAGGLAWLGVLTFGVVSEQVKTRRELAEEQAGTRDLSSAVERKLPSGVTYRELRVGGGMKPQKGDLVVLEFNARYSSDGGATFAEPPFLDTKSKKPVVLVWGARPLAGGVCEGVIEAITDGMRAGSRRIVTLPAALGFGASPPPGVPADAVLQYDLTLSRVSVAPS